MFNTFPAHYKDVLDWEWVQFEPYAHDLLSRDLNSETLSAWMQDNSDFSSMIYELRSRLHVATTVDTTDEEADRRYKAFMAHIFPEYMKVAFLNGKKLLESGLKPDNFDIPLRSIRAQVELFREENLPLQTQESELGTAYNKIIGAQTVEWDGEEKTLSQMMPVFQETDRARREQAWRLIEERRLVDQGALNELWTQFMGLRKTIAHNAGLQNYREYAWRDRQRFDYSPEDALAFTDAIEQVVVPAAARLSEKRRQQLGYDALRPWDTQVDPLGRDPLRPFSTVAVLAEKAETIFQQVDPELGEYFATMRRENLLDLDNRKGKAPGGYCTSFPVEGRPFIFQNAVGLQGDVRTLLHEAGHAFHNFERANLRYLQQRFSPMEFSEVASMAMELIAAPYLEASKGGYYADGDANRARIDHLEGIIEFWPYMAVVVAFQHWIYTNHETATNPDKCDEKWNELWERFMKGVDFSGLEQYIPNRWRRQLHIFRLPFYYVEYGLAQLGAVQVWANALQDPAHALRQYRQALALGGTVTLPELYRTAGARLAFDAATLGEAVSLIEKTLESLER
ncbi:MAG: M3 family oligoendopeptidase [Anaerolineaceae bacterium]|nr:M3 family oligoendopeptidase [Anaerolineaceae bacterium]